MRTITEFRCQVSGQKTDFISFVTQRIVGAQVDEPDGKEKGMLELSLYRIILALRTPTQKLEQLPGNNHKQ